MGIPQIDKANQKKPLCYDSDRGKFIYFSEIISKKESIILPSTLSVSDQKKLVIERQLAGRDFRTQTISGPLMERDDVVQAIQDDNEIGKVTVEAEIAYLDELLEQIRLNLK